jgi:hypothetical protein
MKEFLLIATTTGVNNNKIKHCQTQHSVSVSDSVLFYSDL